MSSILCIDQTEQEREQIYGAHSLSPFQRQDLALQVLGRCQSVSELAREHQVSRKFLYQQADKAEQALDQAFQPSQAQDDVLFFLPVTKTWLRQLVLALVLICHASYRGVIELFRDLLDTSISFGSVHNIVAQAVVQAQAVNACEDLSPIAVGAHDEIFQSRKPILVGCDVDSTYCYLLTQEEAPDRTTWGVHLLDLQQRGLDLSHTLADFGKGLRAGQADALADVPCWGDLFHLAQEFQHLTTYAENRAFAAMVTREKLEAKMHAAKRQAKGQALSKALAMARAEEARTLEIAHELFTLIQWMRQDVLALIGPQASIRQDLYDWIVEQLQARSGFASHRIDPLVRKLINHRQEILAFAFDQDNRLETLAYHFQVAPSLIWQVFQAQALSQTDVRYWQQQAELRGKLGARFEQIHNAVMHLIATTSRASSVVENLNSRLRGYFFLRKQLGKSYLDLLRFFLNHRRFFRSESPDREGKSPAEILTGKSHPHWLRLLGFQPFQKAA